MPEWRPQLRHLKMRMVNPRSIGVGHDPNLQAEPIDPTNESPIINPADDAMVQQAKYESGEYKHRNFKQGESEMASNEYPMDGDPEFMGPPSSLAMTPEKREAFRKFAILWTDPDFRSMINNKLGDTPMNINPPGEYVPPQGRMESRQGAPMESMPAPEIETRGGWEGGLPPNTENAPPDYALPKRKIRNNLPPRP